MKPNPVRDAIKTKMKQIAGLLQTGDMTQAKEIVRTIDCTNDQPILHQLAGCPFEPEEEHIVDALIETLVVHSDYDINQTADYWWYDGSDFHTDPEEDSTALLAAIGQSNPVLVNCLLKNGAKVDICDNKGNSPLHKAVILEDLKITETLILCGAKCKTFRSSTKVHPILHTAVDSAKPEMVVYLLENDLVDINEEAVYVIVKPGIYEMYEDEGYDMWEWEPKPSETTEVRFTPLGRAIRRRNLPIIEVIINQEEIKSSEITELHYAIENGCMDVACLLKSFFSDEELADDMIDGKWTLHCIDPEAFTEKNQIQKTIELIETFTKAEWNVNSVSEAIIPVPKCFYDLNGKDLTAEYDNHGSYYCSVTPKVCLTECTLLHLACTYSSQDIIKFLVENGADPNAKTEGDGQLTSLHILILFGGQWETAIYLIENGANLNAMATFSNRQFFGQYFKRKKCTSRRDGKERHMFTKVVFNLNVIELLLVAGCEKDIPLFDNILEKGTVHWEGVNEFHMAVERANVQYVLRVLQHCTRLHADMLTKEDLTWITINVWRGQWNEFMVKIPCLLWIFCKVSEKYKISESCLTALTELMKLMVSKGYDCNLVPECGNQLNSGIKDPLLFYALSIDHKLDTNHLLLKILLEFGNVNLNCQAGSFENYRNAVVHVLDLSCGGEKKQKDCYETVKLLISLGVEVSDIVITERTRSGGRWLWYLWFHIGSLPLLKLLYIFGAKIMPCYLNERKHCNSCDQPGDILMKEVEELVKWKERFDTKRNALNLGDICILKIRKMLRQRGNLEVLELLPTILKDEILGEV